MKRLWALCLSVSVSAGLFAASPYRLDLGRDLALSAGGVGLLTTDLVLEQVVFDRSDEVAESYLSSGPWDKDDVNAFDRPFVFSYGKTLKNASEVTLVSSIALPVGLLFGEQKSEWGKLALMYAETMLWAYGAKELGKNLVDRGRPYLYKDGAPSDHLKDGDWECSFPSGHSTMAFAAASFATTTYFAYHPESAWKWAVAGASFGLAGTTALLRVASGNHFPSDVLAGAAIGTLIGWLVPSLHALPSDKVRVDAGPTGALVTVNL